jgi:AraC-like DNA-binding protein
MGAVLYGVGTNNIVKEMNISHQKQLNQTMQRFDDYLSQLELFVARLTLEPAFNRSLEDVDFVQQFQRTREISSSLMLMRNTNPLIQEVALYIQKSDTFLSDEAGYRQIRNKEDRTFFSELLQQDRDIIWNNAVRYPANPQVRKAVVVKLKRSIYDDQAFGAFIVYINQKFMNDYLKKVTSEDAFTLLLEKQGSNIATSYDETKGSPFPEEVLHQAQEVSLGQLTTTSKLNDERFSISYGALSRLGKQWVYISATPLSAIMKPVEFISTLILIVSFSGIAVALVLSWVASERIHRPLRNLMNVFQKDSSTEMMDEAAYIEKQWTRQLLQHQALEAKVKQSIPSLRDGFLIQLLQGHLYYLNEEELSDKLRLLDWEIDHHRFSFLVFQLSGSFGKPKFSSKDEQLITFAQFNVVQEIIATRFDKHFIVNYQDLSVGAMLAITWEMADKEIYEQLKELAEKISASLSAVLKMRVTAAIGKLADSIVEAPDRLEEVRNALQYRDMNENSQILLLHELNPAGGRDITFPFEIEKGIIHALRSGKEEEAKSGLTLFMKNIQSQTGLNLAVQNSLVKLLGSVHEALLKSGVNMIELYQGTNLYQELMQLKESDEQVDWFEREVFGPFLSAVSSSQELQIRNVVQQVVQHLEQHYTEDLTFETIADTYGINMTKLSRAFKTETGVTYTEYLTRLRLDKCKELLVNTDMKINDIAEMLRYQPAYLIRIFKKAEQMTPGQYREYHGSDPETCGD